MDPDFRDFLERDGELPKATNTSALSGAGVKRFLNRMGDAVDKITFKMDESDEVLFPVDIVMYLYHPSWFFEILFYNLLLPPTSIVGVVFSRKCLSIT